MVKANDPGYYKDWYHNRGGRAKVMATVKQWRADNPQRRFFQNKKTNTVRAGRHEWGIEFTDIAWPTRCPVLGIELDYMEGTGRKRGAPRDSSPSLDRIDNSRGYIKGNVIVVSQLANRIKTSATPEQIRRVADYYERLAG